MMTSEYRHIPVMLDECLAGLALKSGGVHVDATLGGAGHAVPAARLLGTQGLLIGIDQDDCALAAASARLSGIDAAERPAVKLLHGNFGELDELLVSAVVPGINSILFDLGVSSVQIDRPERGFSFKEDGPLDMRMDPAHQHVTAADLVNGCSAAELTRIIASNSDEKWASRIASFIVNERAKAPLETSAQLVEVVKAAIPASARRAGGHPAKRTFQALRIEVNGEFEVLRRGLEAAIRWLEPGGRIAVLSYHSLEDRIVKEAFAAAERRCTCPPDLPVCVCGKKPILRAVTRKPLVASEGEVARNARARSAKLRVAEKL